MEWSTQRGCEVEAESLCQDVCCYLQRLGHIPRLAAAVLRRCNCSLALGGQNFRLSEDSRPSDPDSQASNDLADRLSAEISNLKSGARAP